MFVHHNWATVAMLEITEKICGFDVNVIFSESENTNGFTRGLQRVHASCCKHLPSLSFGRRANAAPRLFTL